MPPSDIDKLREENNALKKQITDMLEEKKATNANLDNLKNQNLLFLSQLNSAKENMAKLVNEKQQVQDQLDALKQEKPSIKIDELAGILNKSLKSVEENLSAAKNEGRSYFIDTFQLEIKSGIEMADGLTLVQPVGTQLTPESLSTVKLSLKARPQVTIASE